MFSSFNPYVILGVVAGVLALVAFAGYQGYTWGADRTTVKYEKQLSEIRQATADEVLRQQQANQRAQEQLLLTLNQLDLKNKALDKILLENQLEASKDPDAARSAISASSVRRLNKISDSSSHTEPRSNKR